MLAHQIPQKGVRSFSTAGCLSSRLNFAQESVTTHLPLKLALQHGSGFDRVTGTPSLLHDAAMRKRDAVGDIWWHQGPRGQVHVGAASPFLPPCCRPLIPHCSFGAKSTSKNVTVSLRHTSPFRKRRSPSAAPPCCEPVYSSDQGRVGVHF